MTTNITTNRSGRRIPPTQIGESNQNWRGFKGMPLTKYASLVRNAEARGIIVQITIEDMWAAFEKQNGRCALSGVEIVLSPSKQATASLDRIDSGQPYIVSNIQWVHKKLNTMKGNLPQERFIYLCQQIASNARLGTRIAAKC